MSNVLINRDFARLWFGQAVSTVGDYVFDTTLVVWVATVLYKDDAKAGPLAVGGLVLCAVVSTFLIGPVAGVFVDRWSHRRIMLRSEVIRFVLVGALMIVTLLPVTTMSRWAWLILLYAVVFLVNTAEQFFNPARFATIGDVVEGDVDRTRAFGLGSATAAAAAIIGPPLAAPLLFTAGIQWALGLNALSYLVSFFAIRSVRFRAAADAEKVADTGTAESTRPSWRIEFVDGLRMFVRNRFLVALALIAIFAQLGTGPLNTLDIYFVRENLHSNQNLLGFLATAMGVGAVIGGLVAGAVVKRINARNATWLGVILSGILLVVLARQTYFWAALVVIFVAFIPLTILNTAISPQLLAVTPKEYLGRMNAVLVPLIQLSSTVSILLASIFASTILLNFHRSVLGVHMARVDVLYTIGSLIIVAAGVFAYFRLPPDPAIELGQSELGQAESDAPIAIPAPSNPMEPLDLVTPAVTAIDESESAS